MPRRGPSTVLFAVALAGGSRAALKSLFGSSSADACGEAFVTLPAGGSAAKAARRQHCTPSSSSPVLAHQQAAEAAGASSSSTAALAVGAAVALAGIVAGRSRSSKRDSKVARGSWHDYERKWWTIEETRDPTTLPLWQRDYRYGHNVLRKTMIENRKKGIKTFWDVRVVESMDHGCHVEMLNSGLPGFCSRGQEGPERLEVGKEYKMECTAAPLARVAKEPKNSVWPQERFPYRVMPIFSHWHWIEQQKSIEKAKEIKAGTIVEGTVAKHIQRGVLIGLDGQDGAKGMLSLVDISRKKSDRRWVEKMFPVGTKMRCYVIHSDESNGRITLGTKEFEDDEHMGWMLSFPERMMAKAEEYVERYHEKRAAYIAHLQR